MAEGLIEDKQVLENTSESSVDDSPTEKFFIGQGRTKEAGHRIRNHRRQKRRKKTRPFQEISGDGGRNADHDAGKFNHRERNVQNAYPMAPYNSNEFLIEDRNQNTPEPLRRLSPSYGMEEDLVVEGAFKRTETSASDLFLQDFSHDYQDVHTQYLLALPKEKIVANYLELENKIESLEKKVKQCARKHRENRTTATTDQGGSVAAGELRMVRERLEQVEREETPQVIGLGNNHYGEEIPASH